MAKPVPSFHVLENGVLELQKYLPFARMSGAHVRRLVMAAQERYAPPETCLLQSQDGVPTHLYWLRQGRVVGHRESAEGPQEAFELEAGDMWPIAALLGVRPVSTRYVARGDCFYLCIAWETVQQVMNDSPELSDFLLQRAHSALRASRALLQQELQTQGVFANVLDKSLSELPAKEVLTFAQDTPLHLVLSAMQQRKVGSALLVSAADRQLQGILTRRDVLDRIVLAQLPLDTPVAQVMTQPVHGIGPDRSLGDAALLMAERGIRHVPVVSQGKVINIVSEHDVFSLQQRSLRHLGLQIQQADSLAQWQGAANAIREFAAHLLAQGSDPEVLTRLVSHYNDQLTRKIIEHRLLASGLSARDMCWVALGSEGRHEQTIATDQDNALIFASETPDADRPRWMAFAAEVNLALDACAYPLCRGGVMASRASWCRSLSEWRSQCRSWMEKAGPEDMLSAAVFFDLRALLGRDEWVHLLQQDILQGVQAHPRFLQQWVNTHLQSGVALLWHGGLATHAVEGKETIDVKLSGTAIVVDAARIMALSQGIAATSTSERLAQASARMKVPPVEYQGWITAFHYLQTLRLKQQLLETTVPERANTVVVNEMNLVDRQMLKIAFRAIRSLQQRLELDHVR